MTNVKNLEFEVLVNRCIYYCFDSNILEDAEYDALERKARANCPTTSPVHGIGSSLRSSYPEAVLSEAQKRLGEDTP